MELCKWMEDGWSAASAKEPDWNGTWDLIIVGLGTAGAQCACTAAGQYGHSVLGIEELEQLGGMAAAGEITEYYCGNKGGLYQKIDEKAAALEAGESYLPNAQGISGWAKHLALQRELEEAGVTLRYDSVITGVWREKNHVLGVTVLDGAGQEEHHRSRYVVDCTGDGILSAMAGCEMQWSRDTLFPFQPFSNIRTVLTEKGVQCRNVDSGYLDPNDPWEYGTQLVLSSASPNFYEKDYCKGEPLLSIASLLGVREGRRIVGESTLRFSDILESREPGPPAFFCYSNMDNHCRATAFESPLYQDWIAAAGLWSVYLKFPVPLGALIPRGMLGILTAGRAMAADHDGACALRMKDEMYKSGEAAACMAHLSLCRSVPAGQIPYKEFQAELARSGCLLPGETSCQKRNGDQGNREPFQWPEDPEKLERILSSDRPGIGLWALRGLPNLAPLLQKWLRSENKPLRYHSAIALALQGNPACAPVLLEMTQDLSGEAPKTSARFCHPYAILGILLIGRLELLELSEHLLSLVEEEGPARTAVIRPNDLIQDREDLRFQYFSHALAALMKLSQSSAALRARVKKAALIRLEKEPFFLSLGDTKLPVNKELLKWLERALTKQEAHSANEPV